MTMDAGLIAVGSIGNWSNDKNNECPLFSYLDWSSSPETGQGRQRDQSGSISLVWWSERSSVIGWNSYCREENVTHVEICPHSLHNRGRCQTLRHGICKIIDRPINLLCNKVWLGYLFRYTRWNDNATKGSHQGQWGWWIFDYSKKWILSWIVEFRSYLFHLEESI